MIMRKIVVLGLSVLLGANFMIACKDNSDNGSMSVDVKAKLWSAPTTQKIMRDREYPEYSECVLNYDMAKNEIEGAQVIITPTDDYKVKSFDVMTGDLKNSSGDVIPSDNVKVYLQKYVRIDKQINGNNAYGTGYQPDPILPFDVAKKYGENTVVGKNQGIYVTVQTEKDTASGVYSGNLTINLDGKSYNVPMNVNVWNFAISDAVHLRSAFSVWSSFFMNNEMDNTLEKREIYDEALRQIRISPLDLTYDERGTTEEIIDRFVEQAKKATKDERVTSFRLAPGLGEGYTDTATQLRTKTLVKMVKASSEDCCLLDKLIFYFGSTIDEPQFTNTEQLVNPCVESVRKSAENTIKQLTEEGWFDTVSAEFGEHIKEKLRKTPMILTGPYEDFYVQDGGITYCPLFDQFSSEEQRAVYANEKEKNGELWWYGCTGPCFPWPTYHIDDHLLAARVLNWMMYDYGIDGNLYWCVNFWTVDGRTEDIYDVVNYKTMNGDGYLFYPGLDYGMNVPVGTLRSETIRDGLEDYEYFYELDRLASGLSGYYEEEVSAKEMLQPLFKRLYTNMFYNSDNANFFNVRREISDIAERCMGEEKFLLKDLAYSGENATINFNIASGYTVKVNGETLSGTAQGQGLTFSKTIRLDKQINQFEIVAEKDGVSKTITVDAGAKTVIAADFAGGENASVVIGNGDNIAISGVLASEWEGGDDSAKVEITSTFDPDDPMKSLTYMPEVAISLSSLDLTSEGLSTVRVRIYNASGQKIKARLLLKSASGEYEFLDKSLDEGWNTLSVEGIEKSGWSQAGNVNKIVLRFDNTVDGKNQEAMPKQTVYIGEILVAYAN